MGEKKLAEAYILGIPFGLFGAHHFYLGRKVFGIVYACTLGLFGLGYIYDLIRMKWLVRHANRDGTKTMMVSDAYLIGVLGGLFGKSVRVSCLDRQYVSRR
jgi:TM2 domain-containing membrane protein YozV